MEKGKRTKKSTPYSGPGYELYQKVMSLPPNEQLSFFLQLMEDTNSYAHALVKKVTEVIREDHMAMNRIRNLLQETQDLVCQAHDVISDLGERLQRHRRPRLNTERDAEIMRLRCDGKTAGQIVKHLQGRYRLTDRMVNAVISRERNRRWHKS